MGVADDRAARGGRRRGRHAARRRPSRSRPAPASCCPGPLLGSAVAAHLLGTTSRPGRAASPAATWSSGCPSTPPLACVWDAPGATTCSCADCADALVAGRPRAPSAVTPGARPRPVATLRLGRPEPSVADRRRRGSRCPGSTAGPVRRTAVTFAAAEAAGHRPLVPGDRGRATPGCASSSAGRSGASRRSSTCAPRCSRPPRRSPRPPGTSPARPAGGDDEQWAFAADVAAAVALDGAVEVAKTCIQVLGGIGFTLEHDAHLYLRRALALRGAPRRRRRAPRERLADARRRRRTTARCDVDLDGRDEDLRAAGARRVAERSPPCRRPSGGPPWSRPAT